MDYAIIHQDNSTIACRHDRQQAVESFEVWAQIMPCRLIYIDYDKRETVIAEALSCRTDRSPVMPTISRRPAMFTPSDMRYYLERCGYTAVLEHDKIIVKDPIQQERE